MLLDLIAGWQKTAKSISPPKGTAILPARGGLRGPAFFPEGFGLQNLSSNAPWPTIMAIGHNFGCESYRNEIDSAGREDDKATWRNLRGLLAEASVPMDSCFATNWFVGLKPGKEQTGKFLKSSDQRYESECGELLLEQIRTLKPSVILLLGLDVVTRAHQIAPSLQPWVTTSWRSVDNSSIGPVAYGVEISGAGIHPNVVALLHPSFSPSNQRHRKSCYPVPNPEAEMVKRAMRGISV